MTHKWWHKGVIYQIYPRSFKDTTGNGVGDLQGIIDKLDYLNDGTENSLGIDAIWISPFYPSPMADFGYDVANFVDVEPMFGDLATFDKLVDEAHKRNIKIMVDYVPNHTSDEHEWFIESRSSRDNPKRDWYIWKDAKPDGSLPNNWGSFFGGPAWTWDETTQQYYFHQFDPKQPDLNWRNPDVRQAMHDVLRFWMARGVDGFRMDVVYMIWKHPDMPDQPLIEGATGRGADDILGRQQQIYAYNYDGVHDIMAEIHDVLAENDAFGVGEIWLSLEERMKYYTDDFVPFNFDLLDDETRYQWDAGLFRAKVDEYEAALPDGAFPNYVLGNHDIPRLASRYGNEERARVAAMLLLTLRGTPTIYMGEELGMFNGDIQEHQVQDPQGKILGVEHTRDVCRTPLQWDNSPHAGFSNIETWLPVNIDYAKRNAKKLADDEHSILSLYRKLMWHRKANLSLSVGEYKPLESPEGTYVYLRTYGDERHLIALNFSDKAQEILLMESGAIVLNTQLNRMGNVSGQLTLAGIEGVVIKLD